MRGPGALALGWLLLSTFAAAACGDSHGPPRRPRPAPPSVPAGEAGAPEPVLLRYLGGSGSDSIRDVAIAPEGDLVLVGGSDSPDFPLLADGGPLGMDVVVVRLGVGDRPSWARRLGGPGYDRAYAVEIGADGSLWVAGRAGEGFPVTAGAFQSRFMGGRESRTYGPQDGFVCRLTPRGDIVFCSYFGTTDPSPVRDLALAADGGAFIASGRDAGEYPKPVAGAFRNRPAGGGDAVVARVDPDGSRLRWATYLGGEQWESHQNTVRVDGAGNPYLLFTTRSPGLASAGAWDPTYGGEEDVYVARLDPADGATVWGTYVGGSGNESTETHEMAVDAAGNVIVAVPTMSDDVVTTAGAFRRESRGGLNEAYVVRLGPEGALLAATLLGGDGADRPEGVAVDDCGNAYLAGVTSSVDFPVTADAFQSEPGGERDAFVVVLAPDLGAPLYASRLGSQGDDAGRAIAATRSGDGFALVVETTAGGWRPSDPVRGSFGGGPFDALLASFSVDARCPEVPR